jgi:hypothetical protein
MRASPVLRSGQNGVRRTDVVVLANASAPEVERHAELVELGGELLGATDVDGRCRRRRVGRRVHRHRQIVGSHDLDDLGNPPHAPMRRLQLHDAVSLGRELPHDVHVVVLGARATLTEGLVLASVVDAQCGDAGRLERSEGVPVGVSERLHRVLLALHAPGRGVDDHELALPHDSGLKDGQSTLHGVQRVERRQLHVVKVRQVI